VVGFLGSDGTRERYNPANLGLGKKAIVVLAIGEVLLKLGLRDLIWGLAVELT